jgi:predicted ribosome quality control (RQC) complex YloA/Tae2 family protein
LALVKDNNKNTWKKNLKMKSKVRFDGIDVAAMVAHLNRVALGRRVINIYNGPNGDTYMFKMDKLTSSNDGTTGTNNDDVDQKIASSNMLLLLESGVRFHTSSQPYENPGMPSQFCAKLRKHLRGLRLEQVTQLGTMDRVVHLVFGSGDAQRHSLMLELYARGNLVLTDNSYTILSLLRSHEYNKTNEKDKKEDTGGSSSNNGTNGESNTTIQVKVGHAYPVTYATTMTASGTSVNSDDDNVDADNSSETNGENENLLLAASDPQKWFQKQQQSDSTPEVDVPGNSKKKNNGSGNKKKKNITSQYAWKMLLMKSTSGVSHYGPSLIEHCLCCAGLWETTAGGAGVGNNEIDKKQITKYPHDLTTSEEWKALQSVLQSEGTRILTDIQNDASKGYILYQEKIKKSPTSSPASTSPFDDKILLEFQPHLLKQHELMPRLEYHTFDLAVDNFFSHLDLQKRILRAEQQQTSAEQRLEKIRLDQEKRFDSLIEQQESLLEEAQLVEIHADMVEKALQVVNSALDSGMDWDQLEDLVDLEARQNLNPVAMLIHKLDLEHDQMVMRLFREDVIHSDESDENGKPRFQDVTVSLHETAHGNAKAMFAKYRASKEKSKKTTEANAKALEAAEETAKRQMLEAQSRTTNITLQAKRKLMWFEKFNWFITTDNYLVLGGRDAQQNEQIVKRYLRPGDAYLHADVHGAASCILRAKRQRDPKTGKTAPLPLSSQALREAGNFTICRSSAWSSRMVTSSWWVESHQVSKTAPTGEYLTVGSFMIRGKKNFLPPTQLEMGLAVLFRLGDDDSILRHKDERRDFALIQQEEISEEDPLQDDDGTESMIVKKTVKKIDAKQNDAQQIKEDKNTAMNDSSQEEKPSKENIIDEVTQSNFVDNEDTNGSKGEKEMLTVANEPVQKKKGLSVKDRKSIKKYGSLEAAYEAEEERKCLEAQKEIASPKLPKEDSSTQAKQTNSKRGKKAKLKRMAKKYADQDEEDRELALIALHAGEKNKKKDKKKAPEISEQGKEAAADTIAILTKDSVAIAAKLPQQVQDSLEKCITIIDNDDNPMVRWDKFDGDVLEQLNSFEQEEPMIAAANRLLSLKETCRIDNFSASLAGIIRTIRLHGHEGLGKGAEDSTNNDNKRKKKSEKIAEEESWRNTLAEEGIVDGNGEVEDTVDDTSELSKLSGKPEREDLILYAVPVCAPYQSLSKYKYKVKLTPGNLKRGKASKQCIAVFLKDDSKSKTGNDLSRDLIKKVADNEWVQAICGDVKISAAGASKAIQKSKAKAKASKKNKNKKK